MRLRLSFRTLALLSVGVVTGQLAWLKLNIGGDFATTAFSDILGIPCAFAGAMVCIWAARREHGRSRRAWAFMGAAAASWGIGEVIWTYYEIGRGVEVPYPGWADLGFLGLIPLGAAGLLSFPSAPVGLATRLRALLDGLIIAGSVLFVGWATVLGPMVRDGSGSLLVQVLSLAYPFGDLVIMAIGFYVLSRARGSGRLRLALIGGGLLSIALADAGFTYLTLQEAYSAGSYIDPLWNAGFLLIALGALRREPVSSEGAQDDRRVGPLSILAPYVPFLVASGVAMIVQVSSGSLTPFLFWNAIIVVLFVVARQMLALYDNLSLNRDLESRVRDRTSELEQAMHELAESHRLQDEFVANTSHELRTPLTLILGSLETMSTGLLDVGGDAKKMAEMAHRSALRLQHLIEDVLLSSGLEGAISCQHDPFDIQAELRTVIGGFDSTDKVVATRLREPTRAVGDPERFRVVLHHLLTNAEKFAPAGSVIRVDGYAMNGSVHAVVSDEGCGIPAEQRDAIFRRFYQMDGSSTRSRGGLGLGLFLARQIVKAMDGELLLDESATGTSFRVVLPAADTVRDQGGDEDGLAAGL